MLTLLFNVIFFSVIFRILGGMLTNSRGDNAIPRWITLTIAFLVLAYQTYDSFVLLAAYVYLFVIIRLLATKPLLDATWGDKDAILRSFYRNLPIVIALPFTSWWYAVFLLQGGLYYVVGRIRFRYPVFETVTVCELISGAIYGGLI